MTTLILEEWPVDKLREYDNNPRKNDHAVDQMCAAIKEMGFKVPVIVKSDGLVVDGHLRLKAARKLGMETVPVVLADDLSETQIKAFRIMINQSGNWGDWDLELLKTEMLELDDLDFDLDLIGFADDMLEELLFEDEEGLSDDDTVPELEDNPISQSGEVWLLGDHRLMCGDSTKKEDVDKLMAGDLADMCFTDSPYNIDYTGSATDRKKKKVRRIMNDNLNQSFYDFLLLWITNVLSVTKGACYLCMSSTELDTLQKAFRESGGKFSTFIIWAKNHFSMGHSDYQRQYEPILYGWSEENDHYWCGDRSQGDVWFINRPVKNDLHPTMKPVELVEKALKNSSKTKDIVLDLFGGSGSTLIACEKVHRRARLMELDPKYVDVIIKRWQEYAGEQAVRENDGVAFNDLNKTGTEAG